MFFSIMLFLLFYTILFFVLLFQPQLIPPIKWLFHFQTQFIIFPLITIVFTYCFKVIFTYSEYPNFQIFCSLFIILLYLIYVVILCYTVLAECDSCIYPNPFYHEWFHKANLFDFTTQFLTILMSSISFQSLYVPYCIFGTITCLTSIMGIIYIYRKQPYFSFLTGNIVSSKYTITFIYTLINMCFHSINPKRYSIIAITIVPSFGFFAIMFGYILSYQRSKVSEILDQLDSNAENFSVNAFNTTLACVRSENELQSVIKLGLIGNNHIICSQSFIEYCLIRFPHSEWLTSIVCFMFVIQWGIDANQYRVFLHFLSVYHFSFVPKLQMFQIVYILMQTSKTLSPLISRELANYRLLTLQFASLVRHFWMNSTHEPSQKINDILFQSVALSRKRLLTIKELLVKFPFCPSVHLEASILYADVYKMYEKSNSHFSKAKALINLLTKNEPILITLLVEDFNTFYTRINPNLKHHEDQLTVTRSNFGENLNFISLINNHPYAKRIVSSSFHDSYLDSLSNVYTISQSNIPKEQPRSIVHNSFMMWLGFFILFFSFFFIFFYTISLAFTYSSDYDIYTAKLNQITSLINFRWHLVCCEYDMNLILDAFNSDNSTVYLTQISEKAFIHYLYDYLSEDCSWLLNESFIIQNSQWANKNVSLQINNCSDLSCTFSSLFGNICRIIVLFFQSSNIGIKNSKYLLDINSLISQAIQCVENSYKEAIVEYDEWIYSKLNSFKLHHYCLLSIELFFGIGLAIYFGHILSSVQNSLIFTIRTIQEPILISVASLYDKLLTSEPHQKNYRKSYFKFFLVFFTFACFSVFIICSSIYLNFILKTPKSKHSWELPPLLIEANDGINSSLIRALYGSQLFSEYSTSQLYTSNTTTIISPYAHLMHNFFNSSFQEYIPENSFFSFFNVTSLSTATYFILFFALVFLIIFIVCFHIGLETVNSIKLLLLSIPPKAVKTNPAVRQLIAGNIVRIEDIKEFERTLNEQPDMCPFLVTFSFNDQGNVIEIIGNWNDFFSQQPNSISDIQQLLEEESQNDLTNFFNEKSNQPMSLQIKEGKEIIIRFTRQRNFIVQDNSHHSQENEQYRTKRKMQNNLINPSRLSNSLSINNCYVIVFSPASEFFSFFNFDFLLPKENINDHFLEYQKEFVSFFDIIDTRYDKIVALLKPQKDINTAIHSALEMGKAFNGNTVFGQGDLILLKDAGLRQMSRIAGPIVDVLHKASQAVMTLNHQILVAVSILKQFNIPYVQNSVLTINTHLGSFLFAIPHLV